MDYIVGLIFLFRLKMFFKKGVIKFSSANFKKIRAGRKNGNYDFNGYQGGSHFFVSSAILENIHPTSDNYFFPLQNCSVISMDYIVGRLKHFLQLLAACRITNQYSLGGFASAEKNAKREIEVVPRGFFYYF